MANERVCPGNPRSKSCRGCKVLSARDCGDSDSQPGAGRRIGQAHPRAKLTREMVDLMLALYEDHGVSMGTLAVWFGVSKWTVRDAVKYLTWIAR